MAGIVNGPASAASSYLCDLIAAYGTYAFINSNQDFNEGQKSIAKKIKTDVNSAIIHSDIYTNEEILHSSNVASFKIDVSSSHPEAISETVMNAIEFAQYVVDKTWNYQDDPDKPFEEAAHDQLAAYKSPVGLFF